MSRINLQGVTNIKTLQHQTRSKAHARLLALPVVIFIAILGLFRSSFAIGSGDKQIQNQGIISYPPGNINLAIIPQDWSLTYGPDPQIIHLDYNIIRTLGNPSIRLEPHTANDGNTAREVNGRWYPCKPGDHIVAKCWIRTESSTPIENADPYHGGRIGIDLYVPMGDGVHIGIADSYPHSGQEHLDAMVRWGTPVWTLKTWDIIIPSTIYTQAWDGTPIPPTPITEFVLWMQGMQVNDGTAVGNAWFADAELYINPV